MDNDRIIKENGLGIRDWSQPVYHVFKKKWFVSLLETGKNVLQHPSMWEDPFENFLLTCTGIASEGEPVSLEGLSENWYGQCWTKNRDSDAMWRIYSPCRTGVCVSTTVEKLFASIVDTADQFANLKYFIGEVSYESEEAIEDFLSKTSFWQIALGGQADGFARTLLVKRPEFSHENEVRLLYHDVGETKIGSSRRASFNVDPNDLLSEVILDPRLSPEDVESAQKEFESLGCNVPIVQSPLYKLKRRVIQI